jgi:hypothetical protein
MDKLRGIVVPEALNSILDFLTSGASGAAKGPGPGKVGVGSPLDAGGIPGAADVAAGGNSEILESQAAEKLRKKKPVEIVLSVSNPEICFPKDPTDPKTKAFIVKASFMMKMNVTYEKKGNPEENTETIGRKYLREYF